MRDNPSLQDLLEVQKHFELPSPVLVEKDWVRRQGSCADQYRRRKAIPSGRAGFQFDPENAAHRDSGNASRLIHFW